MSGQHVTVQVNTDASTGLDIAATGIWGPDPAEGYRTVLIDFNQPVTGVTVDAFMIEHRGRKILVQGATVTGGMNDVLKLPGRFKNITGGFTIALFSTDIESLLNPGSTMRKPSYFTLPDPDLLSSTRNGLAGPIRDIRMVPASWRMSSSTTPCWIGTSQK